MNGSSKGCKKCLNLLPFLSFPSFQIKFLVSSLITWCLHVEIYSYNSFLSFSFPSLQILYLSFLVFFFVCFCFGLFFFCSEDFWAIIYVGDCVVWSWLVLHLLWNTFRVISTADTPALGLLVVSPVWFKSWLLSQPLAEGYTTKSLACIVAACSSGARQPQLMLWFLWASSRRPAQRWEHPASIEVVDLTFTGRRSGPRSTCRIRIW